MAPAQSSQPSNPLVTHFSSPERFCRNCGARVSHSAEECFMCGAELDAAEHRRRRLPFADVALLLGIVAAVLLWWRWDAQQRVLALTPTPTATPTATTTLAATLTATPLPTATPTATPAPAPIAYKVQGGDALLSIAQKFGISLDQLLGANNLNPSDFLSVGQVLTIPPPQPTPAASTALDAIVAGTPVSVSGVINYLVKPGDTLSAIASRYNVDITTLLARNDFSDPDNLIPGTFLVISTGPVPSGADDIAPLPTASYQAPVLVSPPNRSELIEDISPLLRWVSAGLLPENEWYKVSLAYADPALPELEPTLTKATSLRLAPALRPPHDAKSADLLWWVYVVRRSQNGQYVTVSPSSTVRRFTWR